MKKELAKFKYDKYLKLVADIDSEIFFTQNKMPCISIIPDMQLIKSGLINMNERLYKRAKKIEEMRKQNPEYVQKRKLRRKYQDAFDEEKMQSKKLQEKVRNNIKMYVQSQAIICLFRSFFNLCDYHGRMRMKYKVVERMYMRVICTIFCSTTKETVMEIIDESAINEKMETFFNELYQMWENETTFNEKQMLINQDEGN